MTTTMETTTMNTMTATDTVAAARMRFGPGGGTYRIVTTADESGGRHFVMDVVEPPGGGPPRHTHEGEDEYFVVLEGEVTFDVDGSVSTVTAGGSAFVPRGVPHCFKNQSTDDVRLLVMFTPGTAEGFFEYGLTVNGARPSEQHLISRILELAPRYGIELLGPSTL